MSKAMNIAQAMVDRLNAQEAIPDYTAFIDRQKDVLSEVTKRVAMAGGAAIVVFFEGFSNPASNASGSVNVTRRYTVSIYSKPVLRESTEPPADEILEIAAQCLHDWEPDETQSDFVEIRVAGGDFRPDSKFLIYDLDVECVSRL